MPVISRFKGIVFSLLEGEAYGYVGDAEVRSASTNRIVGVNIYDT